MKDRDRLIRTSPVTYADHYGPSVLLIHGAADTIVPLEQSQEMDRALQRAGRPVRLITYKSEGHGGWIAEHEQAALTEVATFLAAHIAPATLSPPPPPASTPSAPAH